MHVALAMGRRVVVLFGPTSHTEIELFGRGEKVIADLSCLACYKQECDFVPNCMDGISVDMVQQAILRQLKEGNSCGFMINRGIAKAAQVAVS
jgi:heptosyltransferase-2